MAGKARGKPPTKKVKIEAKTERVSTGKQEQISEPLKVTATPKRKALPAEIVSAKRSINELKSEIDRLANGITLRQRYITSLLAKISPEALGDILFQDLERVASESLDSKAQVAFIGETGAGKSTLASILLNYRKLLPVMGSTGDACTAAPIKMMFNDKSDTFILELDYVNTEELSSIFDVAKSACMLNDDLPIDTDGPVERIQRITSWSADQIASSTMEDVLALKDVRRLVESTTPIIIEHLSEEACCEELKKQTAASSSLSGFQAALLKEVRLHVSSEVLRHLDLFDLPGNGDEDRARASRYNEYLHSSDALCILTPAVRANSNSCYQELIRRAIGEYQYNGRLGRIVLVCTKADCVDVAEIHEDMDPPGVDEIRNRKDNVEAEYVTKDFELLAAKEKLRKCKKAADQCAEASKSWGRKKGWASNPKLRNPIMAPKSPIDKVLLRKLSNPIDAKSCQFARDECKAEEQRMRTKCNALMKSIHQQRRPLAALKKQLNALALEYNRATIGAQAMHVKGKVTDKFMDLVKEGQMARREADVSTRSIEDMAHDQEEYTAARRDIQVFCTSAAGYKSLSGLDSKRSKETVIMDIEDTDVPALKRHLSRLALQMRYDFLHALNTRLDLALTSLAEAAADKPEALPSMTKDAEVHLADFRQRLENLSPSISGCFDSARSGMSCNHRCELTLLRKEIEQKALKKAYRTMSAYGETPKPGDDKCRGLWWAELKAACRNKGIWKGKRKMDINFNRTVADAIKRYVERELKFLYIREDEKHGVKSTKFVLQRCYYELLDIIQTVHNDFQEPAALVRISALTANRMTEQLVRRKVDLQRMIQDTKQAVENIHVSASSQLTSDAQRFYTSAYDGAVHISGENMRQRMLETLLDALEEDAIVGEALNELEARLETSATTLMDELGRELAKMAESITADYTRAIQQKADLGSIENKEVLKSIRADFAACGFNSTPGLSMKRERPGDDEESAHESDAATEKTEDSEEDASAARTLTRSNWIAMMQPLSGLTSRVPRRVIELVRSGINDNVGMEERAHRRAVEHNGCAFDCGHCAKRKRMPRRQSYAGLMRMCWRFRPMKAEG